MRLTECYTFGGEKLWRQGGRWMGNLGVGANPAAPLPGAVKWGYMRNYDFSGSQPAKTTQNVLVEILTARNKLRPQWFGTE